MLEELPGRLPPSPETSEPAGLFYSQPGPGSLQLWATVRAEFDTSGGQIFSDQGEGGDGQGEGSTHVDSVPVDGGRQLGRGHV